MCCCFFNSCKRDHLSERTKLILGGIFIFLIPLLVVAVAVSIVMGISIYVDCGGKRWYVTLPKPTADNI